MNKLLSAICISSAVLCLSAEQEAYTVNGDGGNEAIVRAAKSIKPNPPSTKSRLDESSVKEIVRKKMREAGIEARWDNKKSRMGGISFYRVKLSPTASFEEYIGNRQLAAMGALLKAQVSLARWLGTTADMSVALNDPGNPFAMDKFNERTKKDIDKKLSTLRGEISSLGIQLTDSERSGVEGVTTSDRFKIASDAIVKKLDSSYDPQKVGDDKKAQVRDLKSKISETQGQVEQLEAEYKKYQNAYSKSLESGISLKYDHVIFGLSALVWSENLSPSGELSIGLGWVWSPKLAAAVHGALVGDPGYEVETVKGDQSLGDWIISQDPSSIGAFRYYVDNQGDRWFLGTAAVSNSEDESDQIAQLNSIMNLFMPLNSQLVGKQENKEFQRSGELPAEFVRQFVQDLKASARANTQGMDETTYDVKWPARNTDGSERTESVAVSVSSINARSAASALKAGVQMALSAAAVERENNRRILEQAQLMGLVREAKKQAEPSRIPALTSKEPRKKPKVEVEETNQERPVGKARPNPGTKTSEDKLKDDF